MASVDACDSSRSASFLQAEFCERSQNRRHYESQIEDVLKLYLQVYSLLGSGLLVFWQVGRSPEVMPAIGRDPEVMPAIVAVVAIVVSLCGLFLAGRAQAADQRQCMELRSLNKVRKYLLGRDPEIAQHFNVAVAAEPAEPDRDQHFMLVKVLLVWSSLQLGGAALLLKLLPGVQWGCAVAVGVVVWGVFYFIYDRIMRCWRELNKNMIKGEQSCS